MNTQLTTGAAAGPIDISGFWRRLGALVIDVILIGLVGAGLGLVLYDTFARLGVWGRLVGFAIALAYFGVMNSKLCGGQTVGKRLVDIKVVGGDGATLPVHKSLLRFTVLGIPWFLNGAAFPAEFVSSPLMYLLSLGVFGLGLAIVYLYIFNRSTRQSLHDLVVGSYVVRVPAEGAIAPAPVWGVHKIVVGVFLVAAAVAPYFTMNLAANSELFASLMQAYKAVNAVPGVVVATVNKGETFGSGANSTYLQVTAFIAEPRVQDPALAKQLAKAALDADPSYMKLDVVQVVLARGFDIGIASAHTSMNYNDTPAGWAADAR